MKTEAPPLSPSIWPPEQKHKKPLFKSQLWQPYLWQLYLNIILSSPQVVKQQLKAAAVTAVILCSAKAVIIISCAHFSKLVSHPVATCGAWPVKNVGGMHGDIYG